MMVSCTIAQTQKPTLQDLQAKDRSVENLVNKAATFFSSHSVSESAHAFTKDPKWRIGERFIFLVDQTGICYAFGNQYKRIWRSFAQLTDVLGIPILHHLKRMTPGTFVSLYLNNAPMRTFVKKVKKGNISYYIGSGIFPQDDQYASLDLIKSTLQLMEEQGLAKTLQTVNNQFGPLVYGEMGVIIFDPEGNILAYPFDSAIVGQNINKLSGKRPSVVATFRNDFNQFANNKQIQSAHYTTKTGDITNKLYLSKHQNPHTKKDFILATLYYEGINDSAIKKLVNDAAQFITQSHDTKKALQTITQGDPRFKIGTSGIEIYDFKGNCIANGMYPSIVNTNRYSYQDFFGQYPIEKLINILTNQDHVWITYHENNAFKSFYAQRLDLPSESIIVGAPHWPTNKARSCVYMVKRAQEVIERHGYANAFSKFVADSPDFLHGDVYPRVITEDGIVIANGQFQKNTIWSSLQSPLNNQYHDVKKIIETARQGGGWVKYQHLNAPFSAYVASVDQPSTDKKLVIFSGFYTK